MARPLKSWNPKTLPAMAKLPAVWPGRCCALEYAETEVGAREVEDLLGRIEYGVYS